MGICKCRKRTDLFCFVHKKAVCESCISSDHQVCKVGLYFDWLSEPDFETPVCGICKGELDPNNLVRLLCLDMFHPECLDVYASSLPATTAQAGYTCPTCDKPMIPPSNNTSTLAQQIRKSFSNSTWSNRVLGSPEPSDLTPKQTLEERLNSETSNTPNGNPTLTSDPSPSYSLPSSLPEKPTYTEEATPGGLHPLDPLSYHPPPNQVYAPSTTINIDSSSNLSSSSSSLYGMTSHRKSQKPINTSSPYQMDDEDEDKYRRKGFMQLFAALGLVSTETNSDSKRGVRLDPKRVTLFFAAIATFIIFFFLYFVVFGESDPITTEIVE